jgi:hypothetical protein
MTHEVVTEEPSAPCAITVWVRFVLTALALSLKVMLVWLDGTVSFAGPLA